MRTSLKVTLLGALFIASLVVVAPAFADDFSSSNPTTLTEYYVGRNSDLFGRMPLPDAVLKSGQPLTDSAKASFDRVLPICQQEVGREMSAVAHSSKLTMEILGTALLTVCMNDRLGWNKHTPQMVVPALSMAVDVKNNGIFAASTCGSIFVKKISTDEVGFSDDFGTDDTPQ